MNPILAAGLFDNPWMVAVIIIVGAFINWLSQQRQSKRSEHSLGEDPTPSPIKAQGEFNLEEALRRLMGETVSPPRPVPPPLPRAVQVETKARPVPAGRGDATESSTRNAPLLRVPPVAKARTGALRFEQLNEQGRHPAKALDLRRRPRSGARARATLWRDRSSMRQAFVASLVFGPPKGLEWGHAPGRAGSELWH